MDRKKIAVSNSTSCWCNEEDKPSTKKLDLDDCRTTACSGNPKMACGGTEYMLLYQREKRTDTVKNNDFASSNEASSNDDGSRRF